LVTKRSCHGVVGAAVASSVVLGVFDGRAGGVDGVRTAGGGVIAVVAASATRRSGVIAALLLRAGGGVLLRLFWASAVPLEFCIAAKEFSCAFLFTSALAVRIRAPLLVFP